MKIRTRELQLSGVAIPRTFRSQLDSSILLTDAFLDGEAIPRRSAPVHWIDENEVHGALILSRDVDTSRYFQGTQQLLVRDDQRQVTHVIIPDANGLALATIQGSEIHSRSTLFSGLLVRAHLALVKSTGQPRVLYAGFNNGRQTLFLDREAIRTEANQPDFPYLDFSQPPLGNTVTEAPAYGLLSYKCRKTGKVYLRRLVGEELHAEQEVKSPPCVGGMDLAILGDRVLCRINAVSSDRLVPMVAWSDDGGKTLSEFKPLPLDDAAIPIVHPSTANVFIDITGTFHVPVVGGDGTKNRLLDVMPDEELATEALVSDFQFDPNGLLEVFPSRDPVGVAGKSRAFGDGITDGAGVIANILERGAILSSNSQSGGFSYPPPVFLNYDMPRAYALKSTQCYTRGERSNHVTMDYALLEADSFGNPICGDLLLETWDMPLPEPAVISTLDGSRLHVQIEKDGSFFAGGTEFTFSDPAVEVVGVKFEGSQVAKLELSRPPQAGAKLSFRSRNTFLDFEGTVEIF